MAQTRIDAYQIEPSATDGQHLITVGGVATWSTFVDTTGVASADLIYNETPSGLVNGANTAFTLANTPAANDKLRLYLDGLRLLQGGGNDYTVTGSAITMLYAPVTGQNFLADYLM